MCSSSSSIAALIGQAFIEDNTEADVTTQSLCEGLGNDSPIKGALIAQQPMIVCGLGVVEAVFSYSLSPEDICFEKKVSDCQRIGAGEVLGYITTRPNILLSRERVALNFFQRLCGIATLTAEYVKRVEGCNARIVDTRKTVPTLRALDKYAVRCGGGYNHRFSLGDGCLIKDNHIKIAGGITNAVAAVRKSKKLSHLIKIEVEAESMQDVKECIDAEVDCILLDNMDTAQLKEAVVFINGRALVEASGGITLSNVRSVAETGVDLISVGGLTHSPRASDISLEIETSRVKE
ncbi:MAG: carboxylating nicotinate-nucleotide diphosphorylase [bacterium]